MRMLRQMSGNKLKDQIKSKNIQDKLEIVPIECKMRENRLKQFGHKQRRLIDATVKRIDFTGSSRGEEDLKKLGLAHLEMTLRHLS